MKSRKNKNEKSIVNYYACIDSYYKVIVQEVEGKDSLREAIVKEIFNGILNCLDKDSLENKARKMFYSTALFENILSEMNSDERKMVIEELYNNYILPMIYGYYNGDLDLVRMLFDCTHDKVMQILGYYGFFDGSSINNDSMTIKNRK